MYVIQDMHTMDDVSQIVFMSYIVSRVYGLGHVTVIKIWNKATADQ